MSNDHPIDQLGGISAVARMVGCRASSVHEWRLRGTPIERCPYIEHAADGRVTCEQLRPDVPWHRVPDAEWPMHPAGRPVHDVARNVVADMQQAAANAGMAHAA